MVFCTSDYFFVSLQSSKSPLCSLIFHVYRRYYKDLDGMRLNVGAYKTALEVCITVLTENSLEFQENP